MWWIRKKNKKIPDRGLMLLLTKIDTKLDHLLSIKFHAMFSDSNSSLEKAISAIETNGYEKLETLSKVKWDSDFLFLVSCKFTNENIIYIFRQPFEYLYDTSCFLYERIITDEEYNELCETKIPFSNYVFSNRKLNKAFGSDGKNLFERYDFSTLKI